MPMTAGQMRSVGRKLLQYNTQNGTLNNTLKTASGAGDGSVPTHWNRSEKSIENFPINANVSLCGC